MRTTVCVLDAAGLEENQASSLGKKSTRFCCLRVRKWRSAFVRQSAEWM